MAAPRLTTKPATTAKTIVCAARDVFLTEGYEAASMDAIARQADVSKATLYAHFSSKETLFTAMMQEQKEDYARQLDEIASDRSGDLAQQLTRAGTNLLNFMLSDSKLRMFRIVIAESNRIPEICQNFIRTTREHSLSRFADIFCHGTAPGRFSQAECEEAARLFTAILRGDLIWNCLVDHRLHPNADEIAIRVGYAVALMAEHYGPSDPARQNDRRRSEKFADPAAGTEQPAAARQ